MLRFLLKTFILVTVLFIGIIIGFQEASSGLQRMKGYDDPNLKDAFTIELSKDGETTTTILGETVSSHNLEDKEQKLEEINSFNFFTNIAKTMSSFINNLASKLFSD